MDKEKKITKTEVYMTLCKTCLYMYYVSTAHWMCKHFVFLLKVMCRYFKFKGV